MVTARIAGFRPGISPPPVRIPITPFLVAMLAILYLTLRDFRQVQIGPKPARVPVGSIETGSPPTLTRSSPCRFTFYVADPISSIDALAPARLLCYPHRLDRPSRSFPRLGSLAAPCGVRQPPDPSSH